MALSHLTGSIKNGCSSWYCAKKCAKNYFIFVLSLIFSDTNFTDFNLS